MGGIVPFRTGDVCRYIGKERLWSPGEVHIIHEVSVDGPQNFSYSTDRGAWIEHEDFQLVEGASPASIKKLFDSMVEEGAAYDGE